MLCDCWRHCLQPVSYTHLIGNNYQVASLSNCFVIGVDGEADSYGAIFKIDEEQVQLMKRRGGVGHDLSHIRPKGSPCLLYTSKHRLIRIIFLIMAFVLIIVATTLYVHKANKM